MKEYLDTIVILAGLLATLLGVHFSLKANSEKQTKKNTALIENAIARHSEKQKLEYALLRAEDRKTCTLHDGQIEKLQEDNGRIEGKSDMNAYGIRILVKKSLGLKVNGELDKYNDRFDKFYIEN